MAGDYHISTQYITVMAQLTLINVVLTPITKRLYHEIIECVTGFRAITMIVFHFNEPTHRSARSCTAERNAQFVAAEVAAKGWPCFFQGVRRFHQGNMWNFQMRKVGGWPTPLKNEKLALETWKCEVKYWLVVQFHHLEKWWSESQWEGWHPIYEMEKKSHVWNHQPVWVWFEIFDDGLRNDVLCSWAENGIGFAHQEQWCVYPPWMHMDFSLLMETVLENLSESNIWTSNRTLKNGRSCVYVSASWNNNNTNNTNNHHHIILLDHIYHIHHVHLHLNHHHHQQQQHQQHHPHHQHHPHLHYMARVVSSDGGGRPVGHLTPWQEESRQGLMRLCFKVSV